MKPAIRVDALAKRFQIGSRPRESYRTLRESLTGSLVRSWRGLARRLRRPSDEGGNDGIGNFWALRDVSFDVQPGDVIGIIGRNGAGKSTLLKILSQIVEPTSGRAEIRGRLASLLEVGTGFHPELTGRENIYLNGAILGMTRREIERKFDDIVEFAEIDQFLDTPVKRYSSGMYVRLAFAVAAHLEPEVLVVDEVLAVGDSAFQKKCLGKMGEVVKEGRTILFVSHNMTAVGSLCKRVVLLERGRVVFDGASRPGIERYSLCAAVCPAADLTDAPNRHGRREHVQLSSIALFNKDGQPSDHFAMGDPMTIEVQLDCTRRLSLAEVGVGLANTLGATIHLFVSTWEGLEGDLEVGHHCFRATLSGLLVYPGTYTLSPWVIRHGGTFVDDQVDAAISFTVVGTDLTGHNPSFERSAKSKCEVYCPSSWKHYNSADQSWSR